jgi:hypothetical protein
VRDRFGSGIFTQIVGRFCETPGWRRLTQTPYKSQHRCFDFGQRDKKQSALRIARD